MAKVLRLNGTEVEVIQDPPVHPLDTAAQGVDLMFNPIPSRYRVAVLPGEYIAPFTISLDVMKGAGTSNNPIDNIVQGVGDKPENIDHMWIQIALPGTSTWYSISPKTTISPSATTGLSNTLANTPSKMPTIFADDMPTTPQAFHPFSFTTLPVETPIGSTAPNITSLFPGATPATRYKIRIVTHTNGTTGVYDTWAVKNISISAPKRIVTKDRDNDFARHQIPRSDLSYSWIENSSIKIRDPLTGRYFVDFVGNSGFETSDPFGEKVPFITESPLGAGADGNGTLMYYGFSEDYSIPRFIPIDFVGLNTIIYEPIDAEAGTMGFDEGIEITYGPTNFLEVNVVNNHLMGLEGVHEYDTKETVLTDGPAHLLNSILLNRNGPYGWTTFKQIRSGQHPVVREQNKDNTFTMFSSFGSLFSYREPIFDSSTPLDILEVKSAHSSILFQDSFVNRNSFFTTEKLNLEFQTGDTKVSDVPYVGYTYITYRQRIFPRSSNIAKAETRTRIYNLNTRWRKYLNSRDRSVTFVRYDTFSMRKVYNSMLSQGVVGSPLVVPTSLDGYEYGGYKFSSPWLLDGHIRMTRHNQDYAGNANKDNISWVCSIPMYSDSHRAFRSTDRFDVNYYMYASKAMDLTVLGLAPTQRDTRAPEINPFFITGVLMGDRNNNFTVRGTISSLQESQGASIIDLQSEAKQLREDFSKISYSATIPIFKTMKDVIYGVDKDLYHTIDQASELYENNLGALLPASTVSFRKHNGGNPGRWGVWNVAADDWLIQPDGAGTAFEMPDMLDNNLFVEKVSGKFSLERTGKTYPETPPPDNLRRRYIYDDDGVRVAEGIFVIDVATGNVVAKMLMQLLIDSSGRPTTEAGDLAREDVTLFRELTIPKVTPQGSFTDSEVKRYYFANILAGNSQKWTAHLDHPIGGPNYNTYDDYMLDVRPLARDHSVVSEFRIHNFIDEIISSETPAKEYMTQRGFRFLEIPGSLRPESILDMTLRSSVEQFAYDANQSPIYQANGLTNVEVTGTREYPTGPSVRAGNPLFFQTYSTTDLLKMFDMIDSEEIDPSVRKLKLKATGVKKFLPYEGFYPSERTADLATQFATSYYGNFEAVTGSEREMAHRPWMQALFSPGILYNTIKSCIAVDYPVFTSQYDISPVSPYVVNYRQIGLTPTDFEYDVGPIAFADNSFYSKTALEMFEFSTEGDLPGVDTPPKFWWSKDIFKPSNVNNPNNGGGDDVHQLGQSPNEANGVNIFTTMASPANAEGGFSLFRTSRHTKAWMLERWNNLFNHYTVNASPYKPQQGIGFMDPVASKSGNINHPVNMEARVMYDWIRNRSNSTREGNARHHIDSLYNKQFDVYDVYNADWHTHSDPLLMAELDAGLEYQFMEISERLATSRSYGRSITVGNMYSPYYYKKYYSDRYSRETKDANDPNQDINITENLPFSVRSLAGDGIYYENPEYSGSFVSPIRYALGSSAFESNSEVKTFDYRLPFESIIDPDILPRGLTIHDMGAWHPESYNNVESTMAASRTSNYKMASNNFFAECIDFFLKDGAVSSFRSLADNDPEFGNVRREAKDYEYRMRLYLLKDPSELKTVDSKLYRDYLQAVTEIPVTYHTGECYEYNPEENPQDTFRSFIIDYFDKWSYDKGTTYEKIRDFHNLSDLDVFGLAADLRTNDTYFRSHSPQGAHAHPLGPGNGFGANMSWDLKSDIYSLSGIIGWDKLFNGIQGDENVFWLSRLGSGAGNAWVKEDGTMFTDYEIEDIRLGNFPIRTLFPEFSLGWKNTYGLTGQTRGPFQVSRNKNTFSGGLEFIMKRYEIGEIEDIPIASERILGFTPNSRHAANSLTSAFLELVNDGVADQGVEGGRFRLKNPSHALEADKEITFAKILPNIIGGPWQTGGEPTNEYDLCDIRNVYIETDESFHISDPQNIVNLYNRFKTDRDIYLAGFTDTTSEFTDKYFENNPGSNAPANFPKIITKALSYKSKRSSFAYNPRYGFGNTAMDGAEDFEGNPSPRHEGNLGPGYHYLLSPQMPPREQNYYSYGASTCGTVSNVLDTNDIYSTLYEYQPFNINLRYYFSTAGSETTSERYSREYRRKSVTIYNNKTAFGPPVVSIDGYNTLHFPQYMQNLPSNTRLYKTPGKSEVYNINGDQLINRERHNSGEEKQKIAQRWNWIKNNKLPFMTSGIVYDFISFPDEDAVNDGYPGRAAALIAAYAATKSIASQFDKVVSFATWRQTKGIGNIPHFRSGNMVKRIHRGPTDADMSLVPPYYSNFILSRFGLRFSSSSTAREATKRILRDALHTYAGAQAQAAGEALVETLTSGPTQGNAAIRVNINQENYIHHMIPNDLAFLECPRGDQDLGSLYSTSSYTCLNRSDLRIPDSTLTIAGTGMNTSEQIKLILRIEAPNFTWFESTYNLSTYPMFHTASDNEAGYNQRMFLTHFNSELFLNWNLETITPDTLGRGGFSPVAASRRGILPTVQDYFTEDVIAVSPFLNRSEAKFINDRSYLPSNSAPYRPHGPRYLNLQDNLSSYSSLFKEKFFNPEGSLQTSFITTIRGWREESRFRTYDAEGSPVATINFSGDRVQQPGPLQRTKPYSPKTAAEVKSHNNTLFDDHSYLGFCEPLVTYDFRPYTPPYYEGYAYAEYIFRPTRDGKHTLDEIVSSTIVKHFRKRDLVKYANSLEVESYVPNFWHREFPKSSWESDFNNSPDYRGMQFEYYDTSRDTETETYKYFLNPNVLKYKNVGHPNPDKLKVLQRYTQTDLLLPYGIDNFYFHGHPKSAATPAQLQEFFKRVSSNPSDPNYMKTRRSYSQSTEVEMMTYWPNLLKMSGNTYVVPLMNRANQIQTPEVERFTATDWKDGDVIDNSPGQTVQITFENSSLEVYSPLQVSLDGSLNEDQFPPMPGSFNEDFRGTEFIDPSKISYQIQKSVDIGEKLSQPLELSEIFKVGSLVTFFGIGFRGYKNPSSLGNIPGFYDTVTYSDGEEKRFMRVYEDNFPGMGDDFIQGEPVTFVLKVQSVDVSRSTVNFGIEVGEWVSDYYNNSLSLDKKHALHGFRDIDLPLVDGHHGFSPTAEMGPFLEPLKRLCELGWFVITDPEPKAEFGSYSYTPRFCGFDYPVADGFLINESTWNRLNPHLTKEPLFINNSSRSYAGMPITSLVYTPKHRSENFTDFFDVIQLTDENSNLPTSMNISNDIKDNTIVWSAAPEYQLTATGDDPGFGIFHGNDGIFGSSEKLVNWRCHPLVSEPRDGYKTHGWIPTHVYKLDNLNTDLTSLSWYQHNAVGHVMPLINTGGEKAYVRSQELDMATGDYTPPHDNGSHPILAPTGQGDTSFLFYRYNNRISSRNSLNYAGEMTLEASMNLFGATNVKNLEFDSNGNIKTVREDTNLGSQWVVSPKFETPVLDFSKWLERNERHIIEVEVPPIPDSANGTIASLPSNQQVLTTGGTDIYTIFGNALTADNNSFWEDVPMLASFNVHGPAVGITHLKAVAPHNLGATEPKFYWMQQYISGHRDVETSEVLLSMEQVQQNFVDNLVTDLRQKITTASAEIIKQGGLNWLDFDDQYPNIESLIYKQDSNKIIIVGPKAINEEYNKAKFKIVNGSLPAIFEGGKIFVPRGNSGAHPSSQEISFYKTRVIQEAGSYVHADRIEPENYKRRDSDIIPEPIVGMWHQEGEIPSDSVGLSMMLTDVRGQFQGSTAASAVIRFTDNSLAIGTGIQLTTPSGEIERYYSQSTSPTPGDEVEFSTFTGQRLRTFRFDGNSTLPETNAENLALTINTRSSHFTARPIGLKVEIFTKDRSQEANLATVETFGIDSFRTVLEIEIDSNFSGAGRSRNEFGSLADLVGFQKNSLNRLGQIREFKKVKEAVIAIPIDRVSEGMFVPVPRDHVSKIINNQDLEQIPDSTIKMVRSLQNYVLPPNLDFINNEDISPFLVYVLEFEHSFTKQDLADMWQNLYPRDSAKVEVISSEFEHDLADFPDFNFNRDTRWLVFKVKQKAAKSYFNKVHRSVKAVRDQLKGSDLDTIAVIEDEPTYSYNWPYDYFSLIELFKMDAEVDLSNGEIPTFEEYMAISSKLGTEASKTPQELVDMVESASEQRSEDQRQAVIQANLQRAADRRRREHERRMRSRNPRTIYRRIMRSPEGFPFIKIRSSAGSRIVPLTVDGEGNYFYTARINAEGVEVLANHRDRYAYRVGVVNSASNPEGSRRRNPEGY